MEENKTCPNCGCDDFMELDHGMFLCVDCGNLVDKEGKEF